VLFAFAGVMKFKMGVGTFVSTFAEKVPSFLPTAIGKAYLYAVPATEFIVGVCLIVGLATRAIGLIASLMLISFMIAVTGIRHPQGGPFNDNITYLCIALAIALIGPGRISVDAQIARMRRSRANG
jgi:putative oxidoreductase